VPTSNVHNAALILNATRNGAHMDYYAALFNVTTNDIFIGEFNDNVYSEPAGCNWNGGATPFAVNDVMEFWRDGTALVVEQNNVERVRCTESTYTTGYAGVGFWTSNSTFVPKWDDVIITYPGGVPVLTPPRRTK
jgi:hypothetical protein